MTTQETKTSPTPRPKFQVGDFVDGGGIGRDSVWGHVADVDGDNVTVRAVELPWTWTVPAGTLRLVYLR